LLVLIAAVLPLAVALELIACLFGRGGIIRFYCIRASHVSDQASVATNRHVRDIVQTSGTTSL